MWRWFWGFWGVCWWRMALTWKRMKRDLLMVATCATTLPLCTYPRRNHMTHIVYLQYFRIFSISLLLFSPCFLSFAVCQLVGRRYFSGVQGWRLRQLPGCWSNAQRTSRRAGRFSGKVSHSTLLSVFLPCSWVRWFPTLFIYLLARLGLKMVKSNSEFIRFLNII